MDVSSSPAPRGSAAQQSPRGNAAQQSPRGNAAQQSPRGNAAQQSPRGNAATAAPRAAVLNAAPAASQGALRRLSQEFEAQAIAAMFQPVFAALPTDGPFGGGQAEAQWRPMLVDAIARDLSRAGGLGIGDAVYRELLRAQEGGSA